MDNLGVPLSWRNTTSNESQERKSNRNLTLEMPGMGLLDISKTILPASVKLGLSLSGGAIYRTSAN